MEFGQVGADTESKPYEGMPAEFPEGDVIQTLPYIVPRHVDYKCPIRHSHYIDNEPFNERGLEQIVSQGIAGLSRLMRRSNTKAIPINDQVEPFHWSPGTRNDRSKESRRNMSHVEPVTAAKVLTDKTEML